MRAGGLMRFAGVGLMRVCGFLMPAGLPAVMSAGTMRLAVVPVRTTLGFLPLAVGRGVTRLWAVSIGRSIHSRGRIRVGILGEVFRLGFPAGREKANAAADKHRWN